MRPQQTKQEAVREGMVQYEDEIDLDYWCEDYYDCFWDWCEDNWDWYLNQYADFPMIEQLELPLVYDTRNRFANQNGSNRTNYQEIARPLEPFRRTSRLGRIRNLLRHNAERPAHRAA